MTLKNRIDIVLGDWSDDGHGTSEKYSIVMNKTKKEMQEAYKASCKALGISFNNNDDYTGIKGDRDRYHICTEYERPYVYPETLEILKNAGCPLTEILVDDGGNGMTLKMLDIYIDDGQHVTIGKEEFIQLLMWFIGYSLPGFEWEDTEDETPVFNGYWDKGLNIQLGYGLYE